MKLLEVLRKGFSFLLMSMGCVQPIVKKASAAGALRLQPLRAGKIHAHQTSVR
jgi:hypothetical protein